MPDDVSESFKFQILMDHLKLEDALLVANSYSSYVSRLIAKLPYDLRANFKRFMNPLQTQIPTLLDLADWLEYEVQVEGPQYGAYSNQEKSGPCKDKHIRFMPWRVTTALHLMNREVNSQDIRVLPLRQAQHRRNPRSIPSVTLSNII